MSPFSPAGARGNDTVAKELLLDGRGEAMKLSKDGKFSAGSSLTSTSAGYSPSSVRVNSNKAVPCPRCSFLLLSLTRSDPGTCS